jgi:hypothetical protein
VSDWLWSAAVYLTALVALVGALGLIWPWRWPHRRSRRRALVMFMAPVAIAFAITRITPPLRTSANVNPLAIDEFAPRFHFQEHHTEIVAAPPDRVYDAIKSVSADQIALFNFLTAIRRLGRPGPESILNAPNQKPILDVAVQTGFLLLSEHPPREIVLGTVVVAPPGTARPSSFTGDDFKALTQPGYAKATMNFVVTDLGSGSSRVDTETRVFATDDVALGRFTTYWRIIFPGSSILRTTWLSAVKDRAERPVS